MLINTIQELKDSISEITKPEITNSSCIRDVTTKGE